MLFSPEKILILHPGKCGGTTIENLFLGALRNTTLQKVRSSPYFDNVKPDQLTTEHLRRRTECMIGWLPLGQIGIYLVHADIVANITLHGKPFVDSLFKIVFVRNPFSRLVSAFFYNGHDRKFAFDDFVRVKLK